MAGLWDDFDAKAAKRPKADSADLWAEFDAPEDYDYRAVEAATAAAPNLGNITTAAPVVSTMPQEQIDAGMKWLLGDEALSTPRSPIADLVQPAPAPLTPGDVQREYLKRHKSGLSRFADTNITTGEMLYRLRSDDAERQPLAPNFERGDVSDFLTRQVARVPEIAADLIELPSTISDAIYGERGPDPWDIRGLAADLRRPGKEMDAAGFGAPGTSAEDATDATKRILAGAGLADSPDPVFAQQPASWQDAWTMLKASPWLVSQSALDMLLAMGAPEAYVGALANDAANERARNDGREVANLGDLAMGFGGAIPQVGLERLATGRLATAAPATTGLGDAMARIAREGTVQIGTENIEELADLVSRQAGTEKGITGDDVLQTVVGATLAGAPLTSVQAGKEAIGALRRPAAAPDPQPEVVAPPVATAAPQPMPAPVLDTARIAEMLGDLAVPAEAPTAAPAPAADDLAALLQGAGVSPTDLAALLGGTTSAPSPTVTPAGERPQAPAAAQSQTTGQPVQASAGQSAPVPAGADLADRPRGETVTPPSVAPAANLGDEAFYESGYAHVGRSPERPPVRADRDQVLAMRHEIGWTSVGGRMVREAPDDATLNAEERQGKVVGRTSWVGQPSPLGGESNFWRNRPTDWTPAQANAAFDALEAGKPLTKQQRRIIDYAQSVADTYAQAEADMAAELEAHDEVTQQRALQAMREEMGEAISQADRTGALSVYELVKRNVKLGIPVEDMIPGDTESDGAYAARLWQMNREASRGPDARATQEDRSTGRPAREGGQEPAAAEALGDFALEQQPARTEPRQEVANLGDFALESPQKSEAVADDEARRAVQSRQTGLFGASETRRAADEQREAQARNAPAPSVGGGLFAQPKAEASATSQQSGALESLQEPEELTENDLTPEERAAFARQSGGREAELRAAVVAALGPVASKVKYLPDYTSLPERLRRGVESRLKQRGGSGQTTALFDPKTGDVYLFTNANPSAERAVFNVAHEITGHQGLRALLGDSLNSALDFALQNPTVAAVSEAIALERNIDASTDAGQRLAAEEALAELAAAVRTGNYDLIADRYGVDVPQGIRASVARAIENFLRRLKALFAKQGATFSDEDVRELLENAWTAAREGGAAKGDALDATETDQTDTAAFKRWFGDSKVVDADGKPLVVYHGTRADFDTFKDQFIDFGFHFGSAEQASHSRFVGNRGEDRGRIMPVYLSMRNPVRVQPVEGAGERFDGFGDPYGVVAALYEAGALKQEELAELAETIDTAALEQRPFNLNLRRILESKGFDGIIYENTAEGGGESYVTLRPEQIKSATANRGTFDPDSPSILESVAKPIPANATGRSVIADGRLLSLIDAAKAKGLDLSALQAAHASNSASAFTGAIDDLLEQLHPKRVTSIKNATTDAERREAGRDPILRDAVQSNEATVVQALRELRDDPKAGEEVVARLTRGGDVSLADEGILLVYKTRLLNERNAAADVLGDANASESRKDVARQAWSEAEAKIAAVDMAASAIGTEAGRMLQFRKRQMAEDFTLAALERKERARLERPLTAEESATVKAMADTIAELQAKVDRLQERVANAASESAYESLVKQMARPAKHRPTLESLRRAANDARARLNATPSVPSRNRQAGAVISPGLFADYVTIGAYHVANGAATFADWVRAMTADLGERFAALKAEHPNIFKASRGALDKPLKADATVAEVLEQIDRANLKPKDVRKLIAALVGEGLRGEPVVIGAAAQHLELAADEVRRLFVQSDPKAPPTLTEAQAELRDLRKIVRIELELERLRAGEPKEPRRPGEPDSPAVAAKKQELAELRKSLKPQRDPEGRYQEMRGKQIAKRIKELQGRIAAGDFTNKPRVPRALNEANQRAQFELDKAKEEFLRYQFLDQLKKRSRTAKILGGVGDTLNLSRALMTSLDFSAILRQGGFITFGDPVAAAKSLRPMIRAMSERGEHAVKTDLLARANAPLYKRYGLELTGHGGGPLSQIEEAYAARWLDRVPTVDGQPFRNAMRTARNLALGPVRGSARAYTGFLNQLRVEAFDTLVASLTRTGTPTEAEGKAIAHFINVATGRGKLPGNFENAAQALNTVFFAPRLVASRFQLLAGQPAWGGTGRTRKLIAERYARFLMGVGTVMLLTAFGMADDDEEPLKLVGLDPRSSDFLRIKFGDTVLDPMTGLAQVMTFVARVATGETVNGKGVLKPIRPGWTLTDLRRALGEDVPAHKLGRDGGLGFGARDGRDVINDFLNTKFAPVSGAALKLASGTDMVGNVVTPLDTAREMIQPMWFGEVADVMEEQGIPKGAAITLLGLLGMGVQHRGRDAAQGLADLNANVAAVKSDVKDRLAALPVDQWPEAMEALHREYGPLMEGVELRTYKADGKYGEAGEPMRTADGKPVLVSERLSDPDRMAANIDEADDEAVHHLIPDNLVRRHPLMARARELGYDLDRGTNLIGLAKEPGARLAHKGSHPDYDAIVFGELEAAERKLKKAHGSLGEAPKADVLDAVRAIEDTLRGKVERGDVPTKGGRLSAVAMERSGVA